MIEAAAPVIEKKKSLQEFSDVDLLLTYIFISVQRLNNRDALQSLENNRRTTKDRAKVAREENKLQNMLIDMEKNLQEVVKEMGLRESLQNFAAPDEKLADPLDFNNFKGASNRDFLVNAIMERAENYLGFPASESTFGATQDVQTSFIGENPFWSTKEMAAAAPETPQMGLWRSDKGVLYDDLGAQLISRMLKKYAKSGVQGFRIYDYANYRPGYDVSLQALKEVRGEMFDDGVPLDKLPYGEIAPSFTTPSEEGQKRMSSLQKELKKAQKKIDKISQNTEAEGFSEKLEAAQKKIDKLKDKIFKEEESWVHTPKEYAAMSLDWYKKSYDYERPELGYAALAITNKDAIDVIRKYGDVDAYYRELKKAFQEAYDKGEILEMPRFWEHTHGNKPKLFAKLVKGGIGVDVCDGDLAGGTSHTNFNDLVNELMADEKFTGRAGGIPKAEYENHPLMQQNEVINNVIKNDSHKYKSRRAKPEETLTPEQILRSRIGGGAMSGFVKDMRKAMKDYKDVDITLEELRDLAVDEAERLWHLLGEPQTLTPYSKNIGEQAIVNVMLKQKAITEYAMQMGRTMNETKSPMLVAFRDAALLEAEKEVLYDHKGIEKEINKLQIDLKIGHNQARDLAFRALEARALLRIYKKRAAEVLKNEQPSLANWLPTSVKHICSGFGEEDHGFKKGKGDIAVRDTLLYARTFEQLSGFGAIQQLLTKKMISREVAQELRLNATKAENAEPLSLAFKSDYYLNELRNEVFDVVSFDDKGNEKKGRAYLPKLVQTDYLENLRGMITEMHASGKITAHVRDILVESTIPGKFKVSAMEPEQHNIASLLADDIINTFLNKDIKEIVGEYKQKLNEAREKFNGKEYNNSAKIRASLDKQEETLNKIERGEISDAYIRSAYIRKNSEVMIPIVERNEAKIKAGLQVEIPGNSELAIARSHLVDAVHERTKTQPELKNAEESADIYIAEMQKAIQDGKLHEKAAQQLLVKRNDKELANGQQVEIPGDDKMAIDREMIILLLAGSRGKTGAQLMKFLTTGDKSGSQIEDTYYEARDAQDKKDFAEIEGFLADKRVFADYKRFETGRTEIKTLLTTPIFIPADHHYRDRGAIKLLMQEKYPNAWEKGFPEELVEKFIAKRLPEISEKEMVENVIKYAFAKDRSKDGWPYKIGVDEIVEATRVGMGLGEGKSKGAGISKEDVIKKALEGPEVAVWHLLKHKFSDFSDDISSMILKEENKKAIKDALKKGSQEFVDRIVREYNVSRNGADFVVPKQENHKGAIPLTRVQQDDNAPELRSVRLPGSFNITGNNRA